MPRIKMTPMVKVALYALRVYLILLLSLILLSFIRMVGSHRAATGEPATPTATRVAPVSASQPGGAWPSR